MGRLGQSTWLRTNNSGSALVGSRQVGSSQMMISGSAARITFAYSIMIRSCSCWCGSSTRSRPSFRGGTFHCRSWLAHQWTQSVTARQSEDFDDVELTWNEAASADESVELEDDFA